MINKKTVIVILLPFYTICQKSNIKDYKTIGFPKEYIKKINLNDSLWTLDTNLYSKNKSYWHYDNLDTNIRISISFTNLNYDFKVSKNEKLKFDQLTFMLAEEKIKEIFGKNQKENAFSNNSMENFNAFKREHAILSIDRLNSLIMLDFNTNTNTRFRLIVIINNDGIGCLLSILVKNSSSEYHSINKLNEIQHTLLNFSLNDDWTNLWQNK